MRDPFHRDIVKGLNEYLDPDLFEQCVCDILRDTHPSLVPIRGGADAGMDGAIADDKGPGVMLVCTTSENVIGNLRKNLKSHLDKGGLRRRVVIATSRQLTPKRKSNLEKYASKLGFEVPHVYDQAAFADRLYRNPRWCLDLLGLSGDPPPLSLIPKTNRPLVNDELLIGREDDLVWLRKKTTGDQLLFGQPGSGKTHLLRMYAKEGGGLFAVSDDRKLMASGIRSQKPKAIIVDDAHIKQELLETLKQLRNELGVKFRIIATCWPSERDSVERCLQNVPYTFRELELLTRDEMVEVIKGVGIAGPNELIHELVNQADGRPGLAATLCFLCLNDSFGDVVSGQALFKDIKTAFSTLVGGEMLPVLASFAIGGQAGMAMEHVAEHTKLPLAKLWIMVTHLAAGGILAEGRDHLAVTPAALRHALVREVFFSGASSLPTEQLISAAPDQAEVALTLICAHARGGKVPQELIRGMMEQIQDNKLWKHYCEVGIRESEWVLDEHPERLMAVASSVLDEVPNRAIPMLLTKAIDDGQSVYSRPNEPMHVISTWIRSALPGSKEAVSRRKMLLDCTLNWLAGFSNVAANKLSIALQAFGLVLDPEVDKCQAAPGSGMTVMFTRGLLHNEELEELKTFWPAIMQVLQGIDHNGWQPLMDLAEKWIYSGRVAVNPDESRDKKMQAFGRQMVLDLLASFGDQQVPLHWAKRIVHSKHWRITVPLDSDFEVLYPIRDLADWRRQDRQNRSAAMALAKRWVAANPAEVVRKLIQYHSEMRHIRQWPDMTQFVCQNIATLTDDPHAWVVALLEYGPFTDIIEPFLAREVEIAQPTWQQSLEQCLKCQESRRAAVCVILCMPTAPSWLIEKAFMYIEEAENSVKLLYLQGRIAKEAGSRLLKSGNHKIAVGAAAGIWEADPKGTVDESLLPLWRSAVIKCTDRDYDSFLKRVFEQDSSLAHNWFEYNLKNQTEAIRWNDYVIDAALAVISHEGRLSLLECVPEQGRYAGLTKKLVGGDTNLYRSLLNNKRLSHLHLLPLEGKPTDTQVNMAMLALNAGYSPAEIARSAQGDGWSYMGKESAMWQGWVDAYGSLFSHKDARIREVGRIGQEYVASMRDRAMNGEKQQDIHGRY